ncbi:MAG: peptide-methionine (R)-S-oxide reductase, partial [Betaproteobacteria bacterium]
MQRRRFLFGTLSVIAGTSTFQRAFAAAPPSTVAIVPVVKTEAEWKKLLTREQFHVLREEGTEYP